MGKRKGLPKVDGEIATVDDGSFAVVGRVEGLGHGCRRTAMVACVPNGVIYIGSGLGYSVVEGADKNTEECKDPHLGSYG